MNTFKKQYKMLFEADTMISKIVSETLVFSLNSHLYHLTTTSGNDHVALKEFYDGIRTEADELAEQYIAIGGSLESVDGDSLELKVYDKEAFLEDLEEFRETITEGVERFSVSKYSNIKEELVEIQGLIDSLKYKLKMT